MLLLHCTVVYTVTALWFYCTSTVTVVYTVTVLCLDCHCPGSTVNLMSNLLRLDLYWTRIWLFVIENILLIESVSFESNFPWSETDSVWIQVDKLNFIELDYFTEWCFLSLANGYMLTASVSPLLALRWVNAPKSSFTFIAGCFWTLVHTGKRKWTHARSWTRSPVRILHKILEQRREKRRVAWTQHIQTAPLLRLGQSAKREGAGSIFDLYILVGRGRNSSVSVTWRGYTASSRCEDETHRGAGDRSWLEERLNPHLSV